MDGGNPLQLVAYANDKRLAWHCRERAVIEAAAITQPVAVRIDAHDGRDHDVRQDGRACGRDRDIPYALFERVPVLPCSKDEGLSLFNDQRQGSLAATCVDLFHPGAQVRFAAERPVWTDHLARNVAHDGVESFGDAC